MKLISLICPHCGAKLTIDLDRRQAFCQYCGNTMDFDDREVDSLDEALDAIDDAIDIMTDALEEEE